MCESVSPASTFAVIPTLVLVGPLALLAALLPALFGGLALGVRRWWVLLCVACLQSFLYLLHAWFGGYLTGSWWAAPPALWLLLAGVALAGVFWSRQRQRAAHRSHAAAVSPLLHRREQLLLGTLSLVGLVVVLCCLAKGVLREPLWRDFLVVWAVVGTGAFYGLALSFLARRRHTLAAAPTTEMIMLGSLFVACIGVGATTLPRRTAEAVQVVWVFEPAQRGAIISSPLVAGDRIYIAAIHDAGLATHGAVYCLERETARVVWQFDNNGTMQHMYSSPCLADGRLYLGEGMHANHVCQFYCLDAVSGRKLWQHETAGHIESSPCVADGGVFFGAGDDGVYCLDAVTGVPRWHFQGPCHVDTSPAVAGQCLYAGSGVSRRHQTTEVFCLDTAEGKVLWRTATDLPVWGSPAVEGEQIFLGLGNGRLMRSADPPERPSGALLCIEAKTGRPLWRYDVPDGVFCKPALSQDHVYFGARDGFCYCLDRHTGGLCWKQDLGSPVVTRPALLATHLYVLGSGGRVCCLDAGHGRIRWTFDVASHSRTKPRLFSSPVAVREDREGKMRQRVYFGAELQSSVSSAAALYCLQD